MIKQLALFLAMSLALISARTVSSSEQQQRFVSGTQVLRVSDCGGVTELKFKLNISETGVVTGTDNYDGGQSKTNTKQYKKLLSQAKSLALGWKYKPMYEGKTPKSVTTVVTVPCAVIPETLSN